MPESHLIRTSQLGIAGLAAALAGAGLLGLADSATAFSCPQSGLDVTCTFDDSGAMESFVVPAGVTSALFTVEGGSGGSGATLTPADLPEIAGGAGGLTEATLALTPGTSLDIFVGGLGGNGRGCQGEDHGIGAESGGQPSGGDGGDGAPDLCAGGGGGGASYVMPDGQIPGDLDTTVLLAAGGGGGGGGSHVAGQGFAGGAGGGNQSFAGNGEGGLVGGSGGENLGVEGEAGEDAVTDPEFPEDGGGGGGGGGTGGIGSGVGANNASPAGGGGGGEGFPLPEAEPIVVPASSLPTSTSVRPLGPVRQGLAAAVSAGKVTIRFTLPAAPATPGTPAISPTDTEQCDPDEKSCVVKPPAGQETKFRITAFGGEDNATLFGTLNGGTPPTCESFGGTLSPDWVQFGFENPKDGKTWTKRIRATGTDGTTEERARRILAQTEICFAAPYKFVVKRGTELQRRPGTQIREGMLAHCRSRIIAEARANQPDLARPCIIKRTLVQIDDGWVVRVYYKVPEGELDPQGRSVRKKKRR